MRGVFVLAGLICGFASMIGNAATWDFKGVVDQCNPTACALAGITVGGPVIGFIEADDLASGPNSTFTRPDISDFSLMAQGVMSSPVNGSLISATLTTDASRALASGTIVFGAENYKRHRGGSIQFEITIDVLTSTWIIETDFLDLGVVATGTGQWSLRAVDEDGDGLSTMQDNCTEVANADQRDTDADGIGNVCDPDLDQNCLVNFADASVMAANFFRPGDLDTDLDGNGQTNFSDLAIMSSLFFRIPGPSGIPNLCQP